MGTRPTTLLDIITGLGCDIEFMQGFCFWNPRSSVDPFQLCLWLVPYSQQSHEAFNIYQLPLVQRLTYHKLLFLFTGKTEM